MTPTQGQECPMQTYNHTIQKRHVFITMSASTLRENPDINNHGGYMQMAMDKRPGSAWCSAKAHNGDKLGCFLSQMTRGVLMIWMAGALQALMDGRWWQGWTGCGGVAEKGGSWRWGLKGVGTFGFIQSLTLALSSLHFSFQPSAADRPLTDWVEETRHGFITLCVALGFFFPPPLT